MEIVWQLVILLATTSSGWFFGKLHTRREKRKDDLQVIQSTISPLVDSIKQLTDHNNALIKEYINEQNLRIETQEANKVLQAERDDLASQVAKLTAKLEKTIQKMTQNEKCDKSKSVPSV